MSNKEFENIVSKRKASILKKREVKASSKAKYHLKREDKYILQAGDAFAKEKEASKYESILLKDRTKAREKGERRFFEKTALGEMFKESYISGEDLSYYEKFKDDRGNDVYILVPNYTNIKARIRTQLEKEYMNVGVTDNIKLKGKLQLMAFITFKYYMIEKESGARLLRYFSTPNRTITSRKFIEDFINEVIVLFQEDIEMAKIKSGLVYDGIVKLSIKTSKAKQIFGKSFIELPLDIKNKKACVNIKNTDDKCFMWSLLAYKHYDEIKNKDKNQTKYYTKYLGEIIEPENFEYPVKIIDIEQFENLNNLKINVFVLDKLCTISSIYTRLSKNINTVNLLLIHDEEEKNSHYVWIKDISRLTASKTTHTKKHICDQCCAEPFSSEEKLMNHKKYCGTANGLDEVPEVGSTVKFKNFGNVFKHPFHVVADFESTLESISKNDNMNVKDFEYSKQYNKDVSTLHKVHDNTIKYQKHVQNSYGLKYNCIHEEYSLPIKIMNSSSPDEVNISFIKDLEELALKSYQLTQQNIDIKNMIMNEEQCIKHKKCKSCTNCKCEFSQKNNKVRHHDHITGDFISSICYNCNIELQYKKFLPVYIHNLKGYDSHLFVTSLFKYGYQADKSDNISCIPNNEERYISFSKKIKVDTIEVEGKPRNVMYEIRFIDTFAFMASSLESLAKNLKNECIVVNKEKDDLKNKIELLLRDKKVPQEYINKLVKELKTMKIEYNIDKLRQVFKNTSEEFSNDEQFKLMTEKGVYPYDYISSFDKLHDTKLPPQNAFYSKLGNKKCSNEDYTQAKKVWSVFNCETMLDYHNIYLKSDVLLLTDIWENFRKVCFKNYDLDCEYYFTAPGLSWDAMLKFTNIELELLTSIEMYTFFEKGIRGGISQISHRHAIANNKYMSTYDKEKLDAYIVYLDANNLYGASMCQYLPYKGFKWLDEKVEFNLLSELPFFYDAWTKEDIMNLDDGNKNIDDVDIYGYTFSVDLHIPNHLHDYFNNYPLCPENISIQKKDLSLWQQQNYKETEIKKLCVTLKDKTDYVVNYRYLKLALSLGVELVSVNRILEYIQKPFMKSYIMKNTNLRKESKNDFEKDFYKLMNNSVYGKTMENIRNRIKFRLISTQEEALLVKNMKRCTIFNENLVGVHIKITKINLCKPIYLGQNILDDSKHLMYNFHYNFMLKNIDRDNIDLLFTDTDSLCYTIRNQDIFQIMKDNKDLFDFSNYPKDNEMYDGTNNKVIGKFKNESIKQITEFVGLRAKLYSYTVDEDSHSHNKCKGVKTSVVEQKLNIDKYRHTLQTREKERVKQNGIRSYDHQLYTESQSKIALSCNDDKLYICDDNIHCYNFGHYKISNNNI